MALKPCLDCGTLSTGTRCPDHQRAQDNQRYIRRGTTAQRGLAGQHAAIAQHYRAQHAACTCTGCAWHDGPCGRQGTPDNPITAGHITPRAHGGTNDPANYRPECRRCNSTKGART